MKNKKDVIEGDAVWVEIYVDAEGDRMIRRVSTIKAPIVDTILVNVVESYVHPIMDYIKVRIPSGHDLYLEDDVEFVNEDCWSYEASDDKSPITVRDPNLQELPAWKEWVIRMQKEKVKEEQKRPKDGPFKYI